jgi:predicted DNA-binding transcriptional regulator AlpA
MTITDQQITAKAKKRRKQHVRQAPTLPLPIYLRVPDLIDMGVVRNWTDIVRLIAEQGFPDGILLSPKLRVWTVEEVKAWLDSRPVKIERRHLQTTSRA